MKIGLVLLIIGQAIKIFIAGSYFQDNYFWADSMSKKIWAIFSTICLILFGEIIGLLAIIVMLSGGFYHKVWNYFHLNFLIKYVLFKRPLPYDELKYKAIEVKANNMNPKWYQLSDMIFKYCVKWAFNQHKKVIS